MIRFCILLTLLVVGGPVCAQGQDSHPSERDLMVMNELLPGQYDNWNQNYFDGRRKLAEPLRHERQHTQVARVNAPAAAIAGGHRAAVARVPAARPGPRFR